MTASQLWNPSLPVAANVAIIEYNRVDAETFKEAVGEGWWGMLEGLGKRLNEAGELVGRKSKSEKGKKKSEKKALDEILQKDEGSELKTGGMPEGQGQESETGNLEGAGETVVQPGTKTLDHLAEAAALLSISEPQTETPESTASPQPPPDNEITRAALNLLTLSTSQHEPPTIDISNPLLALQHLLTVFFSSGPPAASHLFVALEAAVRLDSSTIHPLHIPAPPAFWTSAVNWSLPKVGLTLLLALAASEKGKLDAFARFSPTLGENPLNAKQMRETRSASLRKAVLRAKDSASTKSRTTILAVNLRDVLYTQLREVHGPGVEPLFATFARTFALGICPGGAKLWLVGGAWGSTASVWEGNAQLGPGLGTWEELDEFVRAFEGFAVADVRSFPISLPSPPSLPSLTIPLLTGPLDLQTLQMVSSLLLRRPQVLRPARLPRREVRTQHVAKRRRNPAPAP